MSLSPKLASNVVEVAKTWLGTPYHMGAKIKGVGVDCGTLLTEVYREAGVVGEDICLGSFAQDWFLHTREEKYLDWITRYCVETDSRDPGNIVLFRYGRIFSHGGIIVEWPLVIHAWRGGVSYADVTQPPLMGRKTVLYEPVSGQ